MFLNGDGILCSILKEAEPKTQKISSIYLIIADYKMRHIKILIGVD